MMWIALNPSVHDHLKSREQFNGEKPAWGESSLDFSLKQNIDVPSIGDTIALRMGNVRVTDRRLESPELDDEGFPVTDWYWTVIVKFAP